MNFGPLTAVIGWRVWGILANFNGFCHLASLLHRCRSKEVNQPLHEVWLSPGHTLYSTLCLKKTPTFKLSVALSNLNRFHNFCTAGKRTKFATKFIQHYPHHLRHVATLARETKNSNFLQIFSRCGRKCKQTAF